MNRLLTTDEVANILNVKSSTVRKWVHLERIPVVKLGAAVRFKETDIAQLVEDNTRPIRTWDD